jgi:hypothetical protein
VRALVCSKPRVTIELVSVVPAVSKLSLEETCMISLASCFFSIHFDAGVSVLTCTRATELSSCDLKGDLLGWRLGSRLSQYAQIYVCRAQVSARLWNLRVSRYLLRKRMSQVTARPLRHGLDLVAASISRPGCRVLLDPAIERWCMCGQV